MASERAGRSVSPKGVGPSQAEVVSEPERVQLALATATKLLGREVTAVDLASLAGAPDWARVEVQAGLKSVGIMVEHEELAMSLSLEQEGQDAILWLLDVLVTRGDRGLGAAIHARQLEAARRLGVKRLKLNAVRDPDSNPPKVGYSVWPIFGYEADLPAQITEILPDSLKEARTIQDLLARDGRDWWHTHGVTLRDAVFRTGNRSRSSQAWKVYASRKDLGLWQRLLRGISQ